MKSFEFSLFASGFVLMAVFVNVTHENYYWAAIEFVLALFNIIMWSINREKYLDQSPYTRENIMKTYEQGIAEGRRHRQINTIKMVLDRMEENLDMGVGTGLANKIYLKALDDVKKELRVVVKELQELAP